MKNVIVNSKNSNSDLGYKQIDATLKINNFEIKLGNETIQKIISELKDIADYQPIFDELAQSNNIEIRQEIYKRKDNISKEIIIKAVQNNDKALDWEQRFWIRKNAFDVAELLTEELIESCFENNDIERLKQIADSFEDLKNIDLIKLAKKYYNYPDTTVTQKLVDNSSILAEIMLMFLDHPDIDVRLTAKENLK